MTHSNFTHLHCHSYYSMMQGTLSIDAMVAKAHAQGMKSLALTDTNGLYGWVEFVQTCEAYGIQPLCGVYLEANDSSAVLLAKNPSGYQNLCHLISDRHLNSTPPQSSPYKGEEKAFSLTERLLQNRQHVVVLSRDLVLLETLAQETGISDLYVELMPKTHNRNRLQFAKEFGIKAVATNGVMLGSPQDYETHRLLRAIDENTSYLKYENQNYNFPSLLRRGLRGGSAGEEVYNTDRFFCDQAFINYHLSYAPEAIENAFYLAQELAWKVKLGSPIFPPFAEFSDPEAYFQLRWKCYQGARERYRKLNQKIIDRIEYELKIIRQKGFSHYFLVVEDIVKQAPRTCGRGSVAASIVSYCLKITHVDPIKHDLLFERFLNPGRKDPPDADIDFPWDERDSVLDYIFDKYGPFRAAMVANHVRLQPRAAFREVSKVYGMNDVEIEKASKRFRKFPPKNIPQPWQQILSLSQQLVDIPRHLSVHCGGVVIVPDDLRNHVPLENATKGVKVIQWEKDQTEDFGLVKLDILGNRSLAVIRDALKAVKENTGKKISYTQLNPLHDTKTQAMLKEGKTMGVFYVESPPMRTLQKKSQQGDYEHLVIHSSMIRPAAQHYINEYIRRLHGGAYEAIHPLLQDLMAETYGIMVYQEDVTKTAMALAGFDSAGGDGLRKALSKKRPQKKLATYQEQFFQGAQERGVAPQVIKKVWEMILSFSGYSFCKPHSASYALVSFQSAYLRAHYPAEFMAAVISNGGGYYSTFAYLSEARRLGLTILSPDINTSRIEYWGKDKTLRVGLMQIKGMAELSLKIILEQRQAGPYQSLEDFLGRTHLGVEETKRLILAGCFDSIAHGFNRPQLIWSLLQLKNQSETGTLFAQNSLSPRGRGLGRGGSEEHALIFIPKVQDYTNIEKQQQEIESFGFLVSKHPLENFIVTNHNRKIIPANQMKHFVGRSVTMLGWWITAKTVLTKDRQTMQFISFEDFTDIYETIFFPEVYRRYALSLNSLQPFYLKGTILESYTTYALRVKSMEIVGELPGEPLNP